MLKIKRSTVQASQIIHGVFGLFQPQTSLFAVELDRFDHPISADEFNHLTLQRIVGRRTNAEMLEQHLHLRF